VSAAEEAGLYRRINSADRALAAAFRAFQAHGSLERFATHAAGVRDEEARGLHAILAEMDRAVSPARATTAPMPTRPFPSPPMAHEGPSPPMALISAPALLHQWL